MWHRWLQLVSWRAFLICIGIAYPHGLMLLHICEHSDFLDDMDGRGLALCYCR